MAETEPIDVRLKAEATAHDDGRVSVDLTNGPGLEVRVTVDPTDGLAMAILPGVLEQLPTVIVHAITTALDEEENNDD